MHFDRYSYPLLAALLSASALSTPTIANPSEGKSLHIPSQPLAAALTGLSQQASIQIIFPSEIVAGRRSAPLSGWMPVRIALSQLISGTGLEVASDDGNTIALRATPVAATDVGTSEPSEDIVVTGYQLQNRRAIAAKRESAVISEFITQDDAGQNPDFNIADALRRVPGVFAVFDEDEGRYIAVRGLNPDYSLVTFNGMQLASSDQASRRILIEQVPASAVGRMEVIKSLTPNLDGNAIGGLVNLETRSAFDVPGTYLTGQALAGYYDSTDVPGKNKASVRGDATFSTRFGADGAFGIVLSGSYMERTRDQERLIVNGYSYFTPQGVTVANPIDKDVIGLPNGTNYLNYTLTSKRFGGSGTFEYKPSDALHASLYYGHYTQDDDETRYAFVLTPVGSPRPTGPDSGTVAQARSTMSVSQFVISKPVDVAQARVTYLTDSSKLDVRGSFSQAEWNERGPGASFGTATTTALAYRYDTNGVPSIVFNDPSYAINPANYTPTTINSVNFNVRERAKDAQLDYKHDVGDSGWRIGVGAKFKEIKRTLDREQPGWTTSGLTLADFVLPGDAYTPPYSSIPVIIPDRVGFWDNLAANPGKFTPTTTASALAGLASDYTFNERVIAGYALAEYKGDHHLLVFGGRYENTDVAVDRYSVQAGVATPVRDQNSYSNFLPSAVFSYDVSDMLKVRAAYSKAIGRPNQSDLAGGETRSDIAGLVTISRPNPQLKPRRADNLDLAFEYYFDRNDGIISAGVFHKSIKDEIFRGTQDSLVGGVTYRVSQPQNLSGSKLTGFEFNFVKNSLNFLPGALAGLGVSANFTYIHTDAEIVMSDGTKRKVSQLLEQPSRLLNASLFYRYGPFETRLSYSRPGKSYQSISTSTAVEDVVYKPFNQLDLQFRYKISSRVQLVAEGRNLLGQSRDTYRPYFGEVREINQHGRGFWAGLSFKL